MSRFFYHGTASKNSERGNGSLGSSKTPRLGTPKAPAQLLVQNSKREAELQAICDQNKWVVNILVDADKDEDIRDLNTLQTKVETAVSSKKANRNEPCPCGSGKKYKKCCGA